MPTSIPVPFTVRRAVPLPVRDHRPSARAKIHQAAFDAHLIGVDLDYRIHVSDRLLEIRDGPFLELGLKGIVGQVIRRPRRSKDRPDRDRLARRFEEFKKAA
jgi:putative restriction endonuclease